MFNFILIFLQWLVKRALESRAEREDENRNYALAEFDRHYKTPTDLQIESGLPRAKVTIQQVNVRIM